MPLLRSPCSWSILFSTLCPHHGTVFEFYLWRLVKAATGRPSSFVMFWGSPAIWVSEKNNDGAELLIVNMGQEQLPFGLHRRAVNNQNDVTPQVEKDAVFLSLLQRPLHSVSQTDLFVMETERTANHMFAVKLWNKLAAIRLGAVLSRKNSWSRFGKIKH